MPLGTQYLPVSGRLWTSHNMKEHTAAIVLPSKSKPSRIVVYAASVRKAERSFLDALRVPVENTTPRSNAPTEVQPETGFRFRPREVIELQVLDTDRYVQE
jgi:hypothetical protein